jgi:hypothetical protein
MTEEEEITLIQQLFDLMGNAPLESLHYKDVKDCIGSTEAIWAAIFDRLLNEGLLESNANFASLVHLTALGRTIAAAPNGYIEYLRQKQSTETRTQHNEDRSALGSFLSGVAGVAGLFISAFSFWQSCQTSNSLDKTEAEVQILRAQIKTLATPVVSRPVIPAKIDTVNTLSSVSHPAEAKVDASNSPKQDVQPATPKSKADLETLPK